VNQPSTASGSGAAIISQVVVIALPMGFLYLFTRISRG
jgi:hypothetical protein